MFSLLKNDQVTCKMRVNDFFASSMQSVATSLDRKRSSITSFIDLAKKFDTKLSVIRTNF